MNNIDPKNDGIDHINIYSKGSTSLGKFLSNWSTVDISISIGNFKSIEGLIFYLGSFNENLRNSYGYNAKKLGEEYDRNIRLPVDIFQGFIKEAMRKKVDKMRPDMFRKFISSELPFTHYYCYGGKIIEIPKWQWQIEEWEKIRQEYKRKKL